MMRIGNYTILTEQTPGVSGFAAVAGEKEGNGPLGALFDRLYQGDTDGEKSFEKAESKMQLDAAQRAIEKARIAPQDIQIAFAGDLLNQCIGTSYGLRELEIPFAGLYGACSTMAESLAFSALMVNAGYAQHALAVTSSHFCSYERQFRFPLEYGGQRPPTAQWTATAAGAAVVSQNAGPPYIRAVTIGKIVDLGITDINQMGAAMAPAAADTISNYFADSHTKATDYDLILTGDLAQVGSALMLKLLEREGISLEGRHNDCGMMLYDRKKQDVHAGGSGCGCSAAVLCADVLKRIQEGKLHKVLFVATGALMSTTSNQQGESIPAVAHLIYLSDQKEER